MPLTPDTIAYLEQQWLEFCKEFSLGGKLFFLHRSYASPADQKQLSMDLKQRLNLALWQYSSISHHVSQRSSVAGLIIGAQSRSVSPKSRGSAVCGVGVDLEALSRPLTEAVYRRFTCDEERQLAHSNAISPLQLWTMKEAVFKSFPQNSGLGLSAFVLTQVRTCQAVLPYIEGRVLKEDKAITVRAFSVEGLSVGFAVCTKENTCS